MPVISSGSSGAAAAFSGCKATLSASVVIPGTGTWTLVNWDTEAYDTDNYHDLVTNNNRLTVPVGLGGKFLIVAGLDFAANSTGQRGLQVNKNTTVANTNVIVAATHGAASTDIGTQSQAVLVDTLVAGDWISVNVWQNSTGNLNFQSATAFFEIIRLGS